MTITDILQLLIKAFNINNLPNDNHLPFMISISERAAADEAVNQRFGAFVQKLSAAVAAEDEAMHQLMASPLTPEITQLDERRDQTYLAIERIVDAYLRYPQPETQADAKEIEKYMKLNKVNVSAQYDREYGQIMNLIQDIETHCQAEVGHLNLTQMFASLKHDNEEMFRLLNERDILNAEKVKGLVRECRQKSDLYYHATVEVINAYIKIEEGASFIPFVKGVNETIDRLNLQVFKITGSSSNKPGSGAGSEEDSENSENSEDSEEDNTGGGNDNTGTLTPDENPPGQNPNPTPGEGNGENEDEYTPPDNDGGFGKAVRRLAV